jgi:hypothetical protein
MFVNVRIKYNTIQIYFKLFLYVLILYLYRIMEELLKEGFINSSALAMKLWPDKTKPNAAAKLRNKIYKVNGNSLNVTDKARVKDIIMIYAEGMDLSSGFINLSALAVRMWPDRTKSNAASLLRIKVHGVNGNRMSEILQLFLNAI